MTKKEVWISDNSNPKYQRLKSQFIEAIHEQNKDQKINYYDFLLVAKKLSFRFEESSHLMNLKNYFARNKNVVPAKKLADLLCVSQQSLHAQEQKIIVKFTVPQTEFAPIKEETLQDEDQSINCVISDDSEAEVGNDIFQKMGGVQDDQQKQINQKMAIILSIKVTQMQKKIKSIITGERDHNLFTLVQETGKTELNYDQFKQLVILVMTSLRQRLKVSQDDIKTLFFMLDNEQTGTIGIQELQMLREGLEGKLREFYKSRINKDMVKNTLFKLGKVKNNSIQIYQVKNASLLQFENIEKSIVQQRQPSKALVKLKPAKVPHFGPLKGAALANRQRATVQAHHSATRVGDSQIKLQREKIEKILKVSKEEKRRDKKGETVASKLRSLFIHKVILPRQKMLEQQKDRYTRNRGVEYELSIKPSHR